MKTVPYPESRARFAEVVDSVSDDGEEVVITRAGHDPVVIISLAEYESLRETAYLLRSPANARRLLASIERLENGAGAPHGPADGGEIPPRRRATGRLPPDGCRDQKG